MTCCLAAAGERATTPSLLAANTLLQAYVVVRAEVRGARLAFAARPARASLLRWRAAMPAGWRPAGLPAQPLRRCRLFGVAFADAGRAARLVPAEGLRWVALSLASLATLGLPHGDRTIARACGADAEASRGSSARFLILGLLTIEPGPPRAAAWLPTRRPATSDLADASGAAKREHGHDQARHRECGRSVVQGRSARADCDARAARAQAQARHGRRGC
ncbi:hypothetical protein ACU4GD_44105 [Cupriavidus basilensis]